MEIIPAILPKNFREIEEKIELLQGMSKNVQVDICDGKYVPSTTWPYWKVDENWLTIQKEERGMPEWQNVDYEFDLMIQDPTVDEVQKFVVAGGKRIILHLESSKDLTKIIESMQGVVEIGVALNNATAIEGLKKYADKIQFVQVMGIRKAGFQGQKFEQGTLDKVREIKKAFPNLKVQVDGGVSLENADLLKEAGADQLVIGSALFGSEDIVDSLEEFKSI